VARGPVYVETAIGAELDAVWASTQEPAEHQRWDLRFSRIEYLPRSGDDAEQRFVYERSVFPGVTVRGWGETRGERSGPDGAASALRFGSDQGRSLIARGSGYWRYEASGDRVRFITRYDYEPRWGAVGRLVDRVAFRRLIGWATAWSFDRLRLWLEEGVAPERSLRTALVHSTAAGALGATWVYQGAVPKLAVRDEGELRLLRGSGLFRGREEQVLIAVGAAEVAFGLATLLRSRRRWPWLANFAVLPALAAGALRSDASVFVRPFNPASLSAAMLGLAAAGLLTREDRPSASRCLRRPPP
jgi:hypothetical protein